MTQGRTDFTGRKERADPRKCKLLPLFKVREEGVQDGQQVYIHTCKHLQGKKTTSLGSPYLGILAKGSIWATENCQQVHPK
jgi:hypothetical protein